MRWQKPAHSRQRRYCGKGKDFTKTSNTTQIYGDCGFDNLQIIRWLSSSSLIMICLTESAVSAAAAAVNQIDQTFDCSLLSAPPKHSSVTHCYCLSYFCLLALFHILSSVTLQCVACVTFMWLFCVSNFSSSRDTVLLLPVLILLPLTCFIFLLTCF